MSLDGSAEVIVNASIPALVALRGLDLPRRSGGAARSRSDARRLHVAALTEVTRVSRPWRRQGRRFVQVRAARARHPQAVQVAPFSWSTYELAEKDGLVVYRQTIGASALRPGTLQNVGWSGGELVAFRLHLPSKIVVAQRARPRDERDERHRARQHPVVGAAPDRSSRRTARLPSKCGWTVSRSSTARCGCSPAPSPPRSSLIGAPHLADDAQGRERAATAA